MGVETHAVVKFIDNNPGWLEPHLPAGWKPEQVKRQALALLQADRQNGGKIARCTPQSLILALSQAASYGLQLDTSDAYIIPYGTEATLTIGWQGLVKLAKRGGELRDVEAEVVLRGEACVIRRSSDGSRHGIDHEIPIDRGASTKQNIMGAYCILTLADGSRTHEYMSRHDIEGVRSASKASNGPAWVGWYGEMAKKAVIRRALKRFNLDPDAASAISRDDRLHFGEAVVTGSRVSVDQVNRSLGLISEAPAPSQAPDDPPAQPKSPSEAVDAGGSEGQSEDTEKSPLRSALALVQHADASDEVKADAKDVLRGLPDESVVEWVESLQHDRQGATHELAEMAKRGDQ